MRLLTKFVILISILGLAVVVSLGFAGWSVVTLDREISLAYGTITTVLEQIDWIKQELERLPPKYPEPDSSSVGQPDDVPVRIANIRRAVLEIESLHEYRERVGAGTAANLHLRIFATLDEFSRYHEAHHGGLETAPILAELALAHFDSTHTLIERVQARILSDIDVTLTYGRELRRQLNYILIVCLAVSVLIGIQGVLLLRRWVIRPVTEIRCATIAIASGDFQYRIPTTSTDELGLLSAEVNHMAGTIVQMQGRLVERERLAAVGEMMRRLAHNLRNPLAGIRGLAELTRSELPADSELRENQTRIVTAVDRFEVWLTDILQSTRPLDIHLEPQAPLPMLRAVVETHQPLAASKPLRLELIADNLPDRAPFDHRHLEHAVVCLVTNAIEATPAGGLVRVIGQRNPSSSSWRIAVHDSGPGIDPAIRARIFVPYFTTKPHGNGIGLAMVKSIVVAHGGTIEVLRSETGGAAFEMTLPL